METHMRYYKSSLKFSQCVLYLLPSQNMSKLHLAWELIAIPCGLLGRAQDAAPRRQQELALSKVTGAGGVNLAAGCFPPRPTPEALWSTPPTARN